MGNTTSTTPEVVYDIYLNDDKVFIDITPDELTETLKELQFSLIISEDNYNCVTEYPSTNRVHIIGYQKNIPVVHPTLLHVILVESR
jgi:hypothetical protein